MQMLGGGLLLIVVSLLLGEWHGMQWQSISLKSWGAVAYLTVFGSIMALSAYTWLLRVCPMSRVSTYAYVNPIVAVLLGTWLGNERFTSRTALAAALIVAAVIMIVSRRRISIRSVDAGMPSAGHIPGPSRSAVDSPSGPPDSSTEARPSLPEGAVASADNSAISTAKS